MFHSLPFKTEPESNIIRCFCSNCTNNNECTTDGSCFVQRNDKDKGAGFVQTCIDKGPHRDSICNSVAGISPNAPDARCCEKDFCNGKRQVTTTMPPTGKRTYCHHFYRGRWFGNLLQSFKLKTTGVRKGG